MDSLVPAAAITAIGLIVLAASIYARSAKPDLAPRTNASTVDSVEHLQSERVRRAEDREDSLQEKLQVCHSDQRVTQALHEQTVKELRDKAVIIQRQRDAFGEELSDLVVLLKEEGYDYEETPAIAAHKQIVKRRRVTVLDK